MHRDGFVTRISHDLYRRLAGEARGDAQSSPAGGRVLEHQPGAARWHWLQHAMRHSIEQARAEAQEHREIADAQWFVLENIELAPEGEELRQYLERFLREFDSEARVRWIKRIWPGQGQDGIVLDALQEVCLSPQEGQALTPDVDAYDQALRTSTTENAGGALSIRFVGSWRERPPAPPPADAAGPVQATVLIRDARGQRAVEMRGQELTLGITGDIPVQGRYVSRRHLRLFVEDGCLWAQDAGSTNGVWLAEKRLAPRERWEIRDHAELRLGAAQDASQLSEEECPRVMVTRVVAHAAGLGATPVLGATPTPVLEIPPDGASSGAPSTSGAPLLTLTLVASGWRREQSLHHLPVTLGRSHTCDLCLPEENEAVSGYHLRLLQLELPDAGVWVEDLGSTRGSYLAGRRSSGRFLLPLGQALTLGGERLDEHHRPVQLTVRRPIEDES
ncbi:MAG TPA: FHA domain-containing protein [bacterium]